MSKESLNLLENGWCSFCQKFYKIEEVKDIIDTEIKEEYEWHPDEFEQTRFSKNKYKKWYKSCPKGHKNLYMKIFISKEK